MPGSPLIWRAFQRSLAAKGLRFTAQVGYFGHEQGNAFADAWVLVDGKVVAEFRKLKRADGLQPIDLLLPTTARFLTLMSTDGGNGISMDQVGFGTPRIVGEGSGLTAEERARVAGLRKELQSLDSRLRALGEGKVYSVVAEKDLPEVRVLQRGDPESPVGDALAPGAPSVLAMLDPNLGGMQADEGERRAALARWISHPANPLPARVIVNRIWHWHFGRGLVATPSDFGRGGATPSHPELLDWLASELVRQEGSLKAIHRLILNSAAYKQESRFLHGRS